MDWVGSTTSVGNLLSSLGATAIICRSKERNSKHFAPGTAMVLIKCEPFNRERAHTFGMTSSQND